jgi:hypothetical protein
MPRSTKVVSPVSVRPLGAVLCLALLLNAFLLLPRVHNNPRLVSSFLAASGFLLVLLFFLWRDVTRRKRALTWQFVPRPVHWVQAMVHSCIYAYWGWYWREVYHELPLIAAQIVFLYALDLVICWSRRDRAITGFGPVPIVLSMNLFLWFRDDWFYLQFAMVAVIVLGKEFVKWKRDGHLTHIFNPSAFSLFLVSIALLVTHSTAMTWGEEISTTFHRPPSIYLEIFLLGLIVQALFSVTLVTLSAAAMLYVLNLAYTGTTGMYHFVDTNIPPAVFLGLHLLVTDPATSPKKNFGRVIFGASYGAGVFALYAFLGAMGAPRFYDKLLCVPLLNLTVRALDRVSVSLAAWFAKRNLLRWVPGWDGQQWNFASIGIWVALFGLMTVTGFLGGKQPGSDPAFWEKLCEGGRKEACGVWAHALDVTCQDRSKDGCFRLGMLLSDGKEVPRDPFGAGLSFGRACDLGLPYGCMSLQLVKSDGVAVLARPCEHGDGPSCFMLAMLYHRGQGVTRDDARALALFRQACDAGSARGCGTAGEIYLFGQGVAPDTAKARESFEKACQGAYPPGCVNLAVMYRQGVGMPKNDALADKHYQRACELGFKAACRPQGPAPAAHPAPAQPPER